VRESDRRERPLANRSALANLDAMNPRRVTAIAIFGSIATIVSSEAPGEARRRASWCTASFTGPNDIRCDVRPARRPIGAQWWCFEEERGNRASRMYCASSEAVCVARQRMVNPFRVGPSVCSLHDARQIDLR
jgi:hypothetical protein